MGFSKQDGNDTLLYNGTDGLVTDKQINTILEALKTFRYIKHYDDSTPLFAICDKKTVNGKRFIRCHLCKTYDIELARKSDEGAIVYVGAYGGIGYKTKSKRVNDTKSINDTVIAATKLYRSNRIDVVTASVTVEVEKGTSREEIKRILKERCKYGKFKRVNVILDE